MFSQQILRTIFWPQSIVVYREEPWTMDHETWHPYPPIHNHGRVGCPGWIIWIRCGIFLVYTSINIVRNFHIQTSETCHVVPWWLQRLRGSGGVQAVFRRGSWSFARWFVVLVSIYKEKFNSSAVSWPSGLAADHLKLGRGSSSIVGVKISSFLLSQKNPAGMKISW